MTERLMAVGQQRAPGTEPGFAAGFSQDQPPQDQPRRHPRARRWARNLAILAGATISAAGLARAGVWVLPPAATNAQQLAGDMPRAPHSVSPGPPVPYRFAAALEATEDHRF